MPPEAKTTPPSPLAITLLSSNLLALIGTVLITPAHANIPASGYLIWSLLILVGTIGGLSLHYQRIKITLLGLFLLLSYLTLMAGFWLTTRNPFGLILSLLAVLFLLLSELFQTGIQTKFIASYLGLLAYWFAKKIESFGQIVKSLSAIFSQEKSTAKLAKAKHVAAIVGLFVITGLPMLFLVSLLLRQTNELFDQWFTTFFDWHLSFGNLWGHLWFIGIAGGYLVTELWLLLKFRLPSRIDSNITSTPLLDRYWPLLATLTLSLLNLIYLLFIAAEIRYDLGDVRALLSLKEVGSFSELAVSRFWELIVVGVINLALLYFLTEPLQVLRTKAKVYWGMLLTNGGLLLGSSFFLAFSAQQRLQLYIDGYGYTFKRLLAHSFLPVLLLILMLIACGVISRHYGKLARASLGVLILFFSLWQALPISYLIGRINLTLAEQGKIIVYDPLYALASPIIDSRGQEQLSRPEGGVVDQDGLALLPALLSSQLELPQLRDDYVRQLQIRFWQEQIKLSDWREWHAWRDGIANQLVELDNTDEIIDSMRSAREVEPPTVSSSDDPSPEALGDLPELDTPDDGLDGERTPL